MRDEGALEEPLRRAFATASGGGFLRCPTGSIVSGQSILFPEVHELQSVETAGSVQGPEPEEALAVLTNREDLGMGKPVSDREGPLNVGLRASDSGEGEPEKAG